MVSGDPQYVLTVYPGDAPVFIGAEGDQERCRDHEAGKYQQNEDKIYGMTVCLLSHKLPPASRPEKLFPEFRTMELDDIESELKRRLGTTEAEDTGATQAPGLP